MAQRVKIAVVGSGPAGLSAAARAAALGIDHVLLEKAAHLSDTIHKYQRGKHIMATPERLALRSDVGFAAGSREAILERWQADARAGGIDLRFGAEVEKIEGARGAFALTLKDGSQIAAEHVVLSIGVQGNPNRLPIPGADDPRVQYQLDDPKAYFGETVIVLGGGDAGIENALGLADPAQGNRVTLLHRDNNFSRAKDANVKALMDAQRQGRLDIITEAAVKKIEDGRLFIETREGAAELAFDRIIARIGAKPPRAFVERCGVAFVSEDREAFPVLSQTYETSVPGLYVIGALAGYPLIKHCMNQGYDVVEYINGNKGLKPADEPLLKEKFSHWPKRMGVEGGLEFLRTRIGIFSELTPLQMREFMLDSTIHVLRAGDLVFERNDFGDSLYSIAEGSVAVEIDPDDPRQTVGIAEGSFFGEIGLISGRRRSATVRAATDCILVETPRTAALKLLASVPRAKAVVERVVTERQLLQIFGSGLMPADVQAILATAEEIGVPAGTVLIREGEEGQDIFIIRSGSMKVSKSVGDKEVFLSYVPAGHYVGETALVEGGRRTATVTAAIKSQVIRLDGAEFAKLLAAKPALREAVEARVWQLKQINAHIEARKAGYEGVVDLYTSITDFVVSQGIGEATDVLLIDETLCIGCDNCELACAESHDGISRLDREAGPTYAHIHVPTSCRHCEHPHCMTDCPPDAIHRAPDGEVFIDSKCIGCGNCQRYCPYGVIQMEAVPPKKPGLLAWLLFGAGPGPGQDRGTWSKRALARAGQKDKLKLAVKCDMCKGIRGGPACVRACPTGAAIRVSPEDFLDVTRRLDVRT